MSLIFHLSSVMSLLSVSSSCAMRRTSFSLSTGKRAIGSNRHTRALSPQIAVMAGSFRLQARPNNNSSSAAGLGSSADAKADDVSRSADQQLAGAVVKLDIPSSTQSDRGAYLYVPPTYRRNQSSPLLVMLHGAGGHAKNTLLTFGSLDVFDTRRCLLLVPASRGSTWDMIRGGFGPDVSFINSALQLVFQRYSVDSARCGLAGFSDGASYALSLGLPNGDLFSHLIAFSPGFMRPPTLAGSPKVYVSHGTHDSVLNIDACSRRLVPRLARMLPPSAQLQYVEFNGGHSVTSRVANEALSWFLSDAPIENTTFSQGPHVTD